MNMGILSPGIFHTKSLTPAKHKIARHKLIIEKFLITSIDEEAGLDIKGHLEFAKTRYSEKLLINLLLFCWGLRTLIPLKKFFQNFQQII